MFNIKHWIQLKLNHMLYFVHNQKSMCKQEINDIFVCNIKPHAILNAFDTHI